MLRVVTTPEGAEVFSEDGDLIGITPTSILRAKVGTELDYIVRKNGYRSLEITATVSESSVKDPMLVYGELQNFSPPVPGEKWEDHLKITYLPEGDEHVSSRYIPKRLWMRFLRHSKRSQKTVEFIEISENGSKTEVVLAPIQEIIAFADWLRGGGIRDGFLTTDNEVLGRPDRSFNDAGLSERARRESLKPFRTVVREYKYGAIQLASQPPGADVYMNGLSVGSTEDTLLIPKVKPGPVELLVVLEGYKPLNINARVRAGENLPLTVSLEENQGVVFGKPWKNGMGMRFQPMGDDLMVAAWETRVRDYETFFREAKYGRPRRPEFTQEPDHPVIYVSREDAEAFCEWLTATEREEERISQSHQYRLPTDIEWSRMVGLDSEIGDAPGQRDANKPTLYSWGTEWPPPDGHANYADASSADLPGTPPDRVIADYKDGYPRTAPVGSFPANELGLYDLSGNVHEWVADDMSTIGTSSLGILRGGGWNTFLRENLLLGWRNPVPSNFHGTYYGFRIVLAKTTPASRNNP